MVKKITLVILAFLFTFPAVGLAENGSELKLSGELSGGEVHFSAPDDRYIFEGKVHIKNEGKKDAEGLKLVINTSDNIRFPMDYEDPIDLGTIASGDALNKEFTIKMFGGDPGSEPELSVTVAVTDDDDELIEIADLNGEIDLTVMKKSYVDVDATIDGVVNKDEKGNYILDIALEGKNNSIYKIEHEDEIYVGFELPYNVELETEKAPEGMYYSIANGAGIVVVQIEADAEKSFSKEYSIPLKGEFHSDMMENTKKRILMNQRHPGAINEFTQSGVVNGQTDLDFTAMDEESAEEEKDTEPATTEDTATAVKSENTKLKQQPTIEDAPFFDTPFYVGILIGALATTIIAMLISIRKKSK